MRIAMIVPGSGGGFYCQNCLRDAALAGALLRQGEDVLLVPVYLPASDPDSLSQDVPTSPLFYGAVGLYLRHVAPLLRRLPRSVQRLLDARPVLGLAARRAGSTRAAGLTDLTVSILRGVQGAQAGELMELVSWLSHSFRPDIIHLSNGLLLGLARPLKETTGAAVVCMLQDEDIWMRGMPADSAAQVWQEMQKHVGDVDHYVSVSRAFADRMEQLAGVPKQRLSVIPVGIDPDRYAPADSPPDPPTIGYLSRLSPMEGLDLLVDAFIQLRREPRFSHIRLAATGGTSPDDRAFLAQIRRSLRRVGLLDSVALDPERFRTDRVGFLRSLSLLSVPVPGGEAFGTYLIEAMACGVPVVQPRSGGFEEVLAAARGGVLYEPDGANALARALGMLLDDPIRMQRLGSEGREGVRQHFSLDVMAARILKIYAEVRGG